MAVRVPSTIVPYNENYPAVNAEHVGMPDGSRLSDLSVAPKIAEGAEELQPETYYTFGEVSQLSVTLAEKDDGKAHEYLFEFVPKEDFSGLAITPEPVWVAEPQYPAGKTCQVSILRGLAVMGCG